MAQGLYIAVREARFQHVKYLLAAGLEPCVRNYGGENALIAALQIEDEFKRKHMFNLLLRSGVPASNRDAKGRDALMWAAILNRYDQFIRVLGDVSCNFDIMRHDKRGYTILHYICYNNNVPMLMAILRVMKKYRISVDIKDAMGETPYALSRRIGHNEVAAILAEAGASVHIFDVRFMKCFQKTSTHCKLQPTKVKKVKRKYPEQLEYPRETTLPAIKISSKTQEGRDSLPKYASSAKIRQMEDVVPLKSELRLTRAKTAPQILLTSREQVSDLMNLLALQRSDTFRPKAVPPPPPPVTEESKQEPSLDEVLQTRMSRHSVVSAMNTRRCSRRSSSVTSSSFRLRRQSMRHK